MRWRAMPLRRRLVVLVVALFALVIAVASLVTTLRVRMTVYGGLDNQLAGLSSGVVKALPLAGERNPANLNRWSLATGSLYAGVFTDAGAGTAGAGPRLPVPLSSAASPVTTAGAGGAPSSAYRLQTTALPGGGYAVVALSMSGTQDTVRRTARLTTLSGIASLLALAAGGTLLVRRELRPLEDVAQGADRIAAGDIEHRLMTGPRHAPTTEVGRMAIALNGMLDELHAAIAARDASQQRLRQFAADASHELRTPLQAIRGYAELRLNGALSGERDVDDAMGRVAAEVRRMTGLVEALLTLARLDEPQQAEPEPVALSELVADACRDAAAVEPRRPITTAITPGVTLHGDQAQLTQLLANLLGNVRMHTPPRTPVTVRLATENDTAILLVHDQGPGIPADALPHVFDRFYRADKSRSRARGGSGLGLAIAAAIVDTHHGSITITTPPAGGTRAEVRLPRL